MGVRGACDRMAAVWDYYGEMRAAYESQLNAYAFHSTGSDYFNYSQYVESTSVRDAELWPKYVPPNPEIRDVYRG